MKRGLLHSFSHALRGFGYVFRHERNFRIHIAIAVMVLFVAWYVRVSPLEFSGLLLVILLVLVLEIINSVVERLVDVVSPRLRQQIRIVKDMLAGMVMLAALGAIAIGALILLPAIQDFFSQ